MELTLKFPARQQVKLGEIRSLAILGFAYGDEPDFAVEMLDTFVKRLTEASVPFAIVERRELDRIRDEIARSYRAEFDDDMRAEIGKLRAASHVLLGTVQRLDIYDTTELEWSELTQGGAWHDNQPLPPRTDVVTAHRTSTVRVAEITMSYRVVEVSTGTARFGETASEVYTSRSSLVGPPPGMAELRRMLIDRVTERLMHNFVPHVATKTAKVSRRGALKEGNSMLAQGLFPEALERYARVAARTDSPYAYYNIGMVQEVLNRYEDAERSYQTALALKPGEEEFARAVGRVRARLHPHTIQER